MNFEIVKASNGFIVRRPAQLHESWSMQDAHVFRTWAEASRWFAEQFKPKDLVDPRMKKEKA